MNKKVKDARADELLETLQALENKQEFNIAADLRELMKQHGRLNKREFKKVLQVLMDKYGTGEYALVHERLLERVQASDLAAIRLWHEINRAGDAGGGGDEVVIVNDLG
ncbi:hypothetical protein LJC60_09870 [Ruminococcaceae bacterium OttesenSCG-928-D13]|nr:hypothetical protein [Ruminococcaceae bacterium OttesenSCG-928-D13]